MPLLQLFKQLSYIELTFHSPIKQPKKSYSSGIRSFLVLLHRALIKSFIAFYFLFFGSFCEACSNFFSSRATLRSNFLMSSAAGSSSGLIPRSPNIARTL